MSHIQGRWKDLIIPVTSMKAGVTVPAFQDLVAEVKQYAFATSDELFGSVEIQHDYMEGTDLYPHLHWAPSNTDTGNTVFQFQFSRASIGSVFPGATILQANQAGSGVLNQHQLLEFPAIPGTGIKMGDVLAFRLVRKAFGDTFTGLAYMISVGIHYQIDITGSNQRLSKN